MTNFSIAFCTSVLFLNQEQFQDILVPRFVHGKWAKPSTYIISQEHEYNIICKFVTMCQHLMCMTVNPNYM